MVGGFRYKALLVLSEEETDPLEVRCGSDRLYLCCYAANDQTYKNGLKTSSSKQIIGLEHLEMVLPSAYFRHVQGVNICLTLNFKIDRGRSNFCILFTDFEKLSCRS